MTKLPGEYAARSYAMCTVCHEVFTSVATFDRHQTGTRKIKCHRPTKRGLVRDQGRKMAWGTGQSEVHPFKAAISPEKDA